MLPDQFLFGSAYPFSALKEAVAFAMAFPLSEDVMANYLAENAKRVFNL